MHRQSRLHCSGGLTRMDFKPRAFVFLLAGLTVGMAQGVTSPLAPSPSSSGSDSLPSSLVASSSAIVAASTAAATATTVNAIPQTTTSSEAQSVSPSSSSLSSGTSAESSLSASAAVSRSPELPVRQNQTVTGGAVVFTTPPSPASSSVSSRGSAGGESSSSVRSVGFATQRSASGTTRSPTTFYTTWGAFRDREDVGDLSLDRSTTVAVTPSTVVGSRENVSSAYYSEQRSPLSGQTWISDVSPDVNDVDADAVTEGETTSGERSGDGATASFSALASQTPSFHTAVSGDSATRLATDSVSFSASDDEHDVPVDQSSAVPTRRVVDFTASLPGGDEAESSHSTSAPSFGAEIQPGTSFHPIHGSVASESTELGLASSSFQTTTAVLEPSSVIHFSPSRETMVESHGVHSTASLPKSKEILFSSVHSTELLPSSSSSAAAASLSSSWSETQQTYEDRSLQTVSLFLGTASEIAPVSTTTVTFLSTHATDGLKDSSLVTLRVSASSTLPSVTATAHVTLPPTPTPTPVVTEEVPASTPTPTNTTTTTNNTTTTISSSRITVLITTTTTTTLPPRRDVRYLFTLTGDCHLILNNTEFFQRFLAGFHDLVVKQLGIAQEAYRLGEIACGTVHVYVTFVRVRMPDFDLRLQSILRNGGPGLSVPVWIDSHFATFDLIHARQVALAPDEHTFNLVAEVMDDVDIIVIVVACCICGVLIAIGVAICVKECYRRKHASSFSLLDVPHVNLKLEDFTLTRIPRPRTIYKDPKGGGGGGGGGSLLCPGHGDSTGVVYTDLPTSDSGPSSNGHLLKDSGITNSSIISSSSSNSNGRALQPSDLHLRVREHSDGIIVGVTASVTPYQQPPPASYNHHHHQQQQHLHQQHHYPITSHNNSQRMEEGLSNGTAAKRSSSSSSSSSGGGGSGSKPRIRTPTADDVEDEGQASQRLLGVSRQRGGGGGRREEEEEAGGTPNPVFVHELDEEEEEGGGGRHRGGGALLL